MLLSDHFVKRYLDKKHLIVSFWICFWLLSRSFDKFQTGGRSRRSTDGSQTLLSESRHWRDVFWLGIFVIHLIGLGFLLSVLGLNRFKKTDRFNISRYTNQKVETKGELTEDYWPIYAVAGGVGALLGWMWLLLLGSPANQMLKISVHILTTYLAVISVLCFWCDQFFWGVAFAIAAALQFLYVISVIDRYELENPYIYWVALILKSLVFSKSERYLINCHVIYLGIHISLLDQFIIIWSIHHWNFHSLQHCIFFINMLIGELLE